MRWQSLLCLFVGFVAASSNPGWQDNKEYIYQFRGRTLISLNEISSNYTGIFLKAKLNIHTKTNGKFLAHLTEPQYAQFHGQLINGWEKEISDSELEYNNLDYLNKPFEIFMKNGVVSNLMVTRETSNWEANIIKSIVSQFQLDTNAEKYIQSSINNLPELNSNNGVFKTMEDTVSGISETLYEIHPLPEYILQTTPWLAPLKDLDEDSEIIEVVKNKNFTNSEDRPAYHFGFDGIEDFELSNKIGEFFSRSSVSRSIISGSLKRYTVQSSVTVDQILVNPTLTDKQVGSVYTIVNVTLVGVKESSLTVNDQKLVGPVDVGLVYKFNQPFSDNNEPQSKENFSPNSDFMSAEANIFSNEQDKTARTKLEILLTGRSYDSDSSSSSEENNARIQHWPKLSEAPASPLLPFTVGYNGLSIKKKQNIHENVQQIAKLIGQESSRPEQVLHEKTIGKFVILTSLLRVMDHNEMEQVARTIPKGFAWKAFRDGVAQAGTGPALLVINSWIKTKQVKNEEAAEVVCRAADAARQPTLDYMKYFYKMVQSNHVRSQPYLNESALLCYTTLVNEVYINKQYSHNKYPVHSFESFRNKEGVEFVRNKVIPELSSALHQSVVKADSRNIHIYIRALGNIGDRKILEAFQPYLEGQKHASQFQRLLMVVALDKLTNSHRKTARAILYRIYRNSYEDEQVRVAAVGQLMRSNPSPSMLQRMASYTNEDPSKYVNAAVKSAIETASQLKGSEHAKLRSAAFSAKPLLTPEIFSEQYSQERLRSHVVHQMKMIYKQTLQTFLGEDYPWPKGVRYTLRGRFGGFKQHVINMQAMLSSVDDIINVFQQQTANYQTNKKQKQSENSDGFKMSSQYTANLFNMENEQREQLEGMLYYHIGALQRIWSLDNHTIENIPEVIRQIEQEWNNKKEFNYWKMSIQNEVAVSFPTGMGLPFIYTYDQPTFVKLQANLKATATPPVSSENLLHRPNLINSEFEVAASISARTQSQFGIFTPFDSQRYSAGYQKNFQVVLPVVGEVQFDIENKQLKIHLQPMGSNKINLLHFSTEPFTASNDIYNPKPQIEVIKREHPYKVDQEMGHKTTGIVFNVQVVSDEPVDYASVYEKLHHHDLVSSLLSPWWDENMKYFKIDLNMDMAQSTTKKVILFAGCQHRYGSGLRDNEESIISKIDKIPDEAVNREKRQLKFMELSSINIDRAMSHAVDFYLIFSGENEIRFTATLAASKSNMDPKGRIVLHFKKHGKEEKPKNFYLSAVSNFPNINGLNMDYAMQMNPTSKVRIDAGLGETYMKSNKISANIILSKSEERKQYLMEQPEYQECKRQMQQGNYQLPVCAKVTAEANLLDEFDMKIMYNDIDLSVINVTYKLYSILRHNWYPNVEEDITHEESNKNHLHVKAHFHPDLKALNISIDSEFGRAEARNLELSEWAKELLVPHPVFHVKTRMMKYLHKHYNYKPICVVDKTAASTFDNKTYPLNLNDWTVMLHYVPRRPSPDQSQSQQPVSDQLKNQIEEYIVWVRPYQNQPSQKEMKMIIQTPQTQGKIVDISLKPGDSSDLPRLFINNEQVDYKQNGQYFYGDYIQTYALPNNEIKIELTDDYYIIYDGVRVKLTADETKFSDASRGLCGTFTGEENTDFLSPKYCILQTPKEFVQSYTLSNAQSQQGPKCYQKKVGYVKIVAPEDVDNDNNQRKNHQRMSCTKHQTKYVDLEDEICFTLRPLPVCKPGCLQQGSVSKKIPVHCVESTSATELWKNQIDKGASPDFSMKTESRKIKMKVPLRCSP